MTVFLIPLLLLSADLVVLQNDHLRVEIEPDLFAVRFVGQPGGQNFLEPVFVPEAVRASGEWCDPGGVTTDLAPYEGRDAALRRGPAEIILQEKHRLVLLGPPSASLGLRVKKDFELSRDDPRLTLRVSMLTDQEKVSEYALRNSVRLPKDTTVRLDRSNETLRVLTAHGSPGPAVIKSMRYWLIPIPPMTKVEEMVLGANATSMEIQNDAGIWTRSVELKRGGDTPLNASFLCLLDTTTGSYGAAFQTPLQPISASRPGIMVETWTFSFHKQKD